MKTAERFYLYPGWLRVWHGINALCILALIFSGMSLHYADRSFFLLNFKLAISVHNISGVIISVNYFIFLLGNLFTKNGKHYRIKMQGLAKRLKIQILYYVDGMFKGDEPPYPLSNKRKFNPLQKYSYILVMYIFFPVLILTGFGLFFPEIILEQVFQYSGMMVTALLHSLSGFIVFIFLIIHLYVASLGKSPSKNFKSIVTGWHT